MGYGGRTTVDKFMGTLLPITAFVAGGFEHFIANGNGPVVALSGLAADKMRYLTPGYLTQNLIFATLGNIVGGAFLVGLVYRLIYLRSDSGTRSPKSWAAA
ncbi:MAG TPA: formate/nitrite transporter family protein [Symbiobacteriaceae bacterium]|nr:formate/nitrite transporter family protein [Symbiobacteriaceae bacterium]